MYATTFTVAQIRAAEAVLLAAETEPDQLMRNAAHSVFRVAELMLGWATLADDHFPSDSPTRTLILAGPGGNGGDALYAGAELALAGRKVDACLTAGDAHERALNAFTNAGGTVLEALPEERWRYIETYALAIDGITGIGGSAGLRPELAGAVELLNQGREYGVPVLAVDLPSGIEADTGLGGGLHVTADVTVTFGGWRRAHVLNPACGVQLLASLELPHMSINEPLVDTLPEWAADGPPLLSANRAVVPSPLAGGWPEDMTTLRPAPVTNTAPGPEDDKYSGGVVGIRAGSDTYPGAAILCTAAAINATPSMVRYAGPQALEVVRALPECVVTQKLEDAGRVQAWVFGPGAGTDAAAAQELRWVLAQEVPVLIDADGLTLIAEHAELRELVKERREATVLTPHDGEFERLRKAVGVEASNRYEEVRALATAMKCSVVRKGRVTLIAPEEEFFWVLGVDAGHSWAATPGSGDVLAGIAGAYLALGHARDWPVEFALAGAVSVHAIAAKLAAGTPYGDATAPASRIVEFVREATAQSHRKEPFVI
ncbi:bifunctional ADP-dependent NAD(P)H-hydrate dehydratase/NAD(P)H-hydrate epimerase [Corynebacterium sp. TA-R-1]|uniref:ADP-dependent (S)-NAD(P)H-hydrate dehydratase n=1 Tax=Corynebacterium stercoris TaxID=2943490 RepID=A0ABT1G3V3_9CORY|nr:bifunctional ADP-dependent NAD(P)H-hydrate dehydratase/NAD(P)H-hydrate epimerase [Corynebacterium stercoris]MCP1388665.1 bifunctional ADP-dependent NAD(P)H-hydrate dehydratase/NAD(P)H-hydrate epimerase [Corynebacterium stercoris]